jgi:hypothetical protein
MCSQPHKDESTTESMLDEKLLTLYEDWKSHSNCFSSDDDEKAIIKMFADSMDERLKVLKDINKDIAQD